MESDRPHGNRHLTEPGGRRRDAPRIVAHLRRLGRRLLDVVLPPQCLACGRIVEDLGGLCPECWEAMDFIAAPQCAACGRPFEYPMETDALCGACARRPYPFRRARAALVYDDASRGLLIAFKHGDRTDAAPAYGRWLHQAGVLMLADCHLIVPVPLHWTRLFARRFNQAALLAHALGRVAGLPVADRLLMRRRRTPSQGRLSADGRRRNVAGAFAISAAGRLQVMGKNVLLVDDVFTTGATVSACARVLRAAGATAVDVVTLARVVRPSR
jgi:ComF family protein